MRGSMELGGEAEKIKWDEIGEQVESVCNATELGGFKSRERIIGGTRCYKKAKKTRG